MKACVLTAIGQLSYREVPTPVPREGEVLIRVRACGICSSDVDRVFKTGTYHFPTIPGHEFAGQIVELGPGVDAEYLNKHAAVFPLLPCFKCPSCATGEYARCDNYNYFGSRCDGGFAEYIAAPIWNLILFPVHTPFSSAALCEPAAVALKAVNSANISIGDTVAVIGNGTIGLVAAMWARIQGAGQIIIIGRSQPKLKYAVKAGFQHVFSTETHHVQQEIDRLTAGKGANCVIELVGSSDSLSCAVNSVQKGGTVVLTGNPSGDMTLERAVYWKILRNEIVLKGTWNSNYRISENNWRTAADYISQGKLNVEQLITHRYDLTQSTQAFQDLTDKSANVLKAVFEID